MRFFHVKKEQKCQGCPSTLLYNDEAVVILINIGEVKIPYVFHVGCFLEWSNQMFIHRLESWRQGTTKRPERKRKPKPKIGRPRKYSDPIKAGRLRSLAYYYQQIDQMDKVREMLERLDRLRIQHTIEDFRKEEQ